MKMAGKRQDIAAARLEAARLEAARNGCRN
jgi:hypothetical protein